MEAEKRIAEIDKETSDLHQTLNKMDNEDHPDDSDFDGYEKRREPVWAKIGALSREKRLIMTPTFRELPTYGDVMSLKQFISCVKSGGFIDYDGHGCYVKDGKATDINIYPSDHHYKSIRKDFDTIIWFNR